MKRFRTIVWLAFSFAPFLFLASCNAQTAEPSPATLQLVGLDNVEKSYVVDTDFSGEGEAYAFRGGWLMKFSGSMRKARSFI